MLLGVAGFTFKPLMLLYMVFVLGFWLNRIFTKENKHLEILKAMAYITGAEVFFRMTGAYILYP